MTPCQTSSYRRRLHLFELLVKGALMENLTITGCWYYIESVGYSPQPDGFWRQHLIHQLWRHQADAQLEVLVRRLAFSKEGECVWKLGSFRGVSRSKISGPGFLVYVFQGSKCSQQGSDLVITGPCSWAFNCLWHFGMMAISDWRNRKLLVGNPRGSLAFGAGFQLPVTLSCFLSSWEHHGV